jgi:hypothetical protein
VAAKNNQSGGGWWVVSGCFLFSVVSVVVCGVAPRTPPVRL